MFLKGSSVQIGYNMWVVFFILILTLFLFIFFVFILTFSDFLKSDSLFFFLQVIFFDCFYYSYKHSFTIHINILLYCFYK